MKQPATVVHHSADFDGIFCREIARRFLVEDGVTFIGWNHGDPTLEIPPEGTIYVLDLPIDTPFGAKFDPVVPGLCIWPEKTPTNRIVAFDDAVKAGRFVWIDHHATAIASHPRHIPGYRLDGVGACRLAWQIFKDLHDVGVANPELLPTKADFQERRVQEPLAVRLAGEYDVWDKRDSRADTLQYGLRCSDLGEDEWRAMLSPDTVGDRAVGAILSAGEPAQRYATQENASLVLHRSFELDWEGLRFLCLNTARCNSLTFQAAVKSEHDGLLAFYWNGRQWTVSLYHAPHRTDIDLSKLAVKWGGGGHKGACGFNCKALPFVQ